MRTLSEQLRDERRQVLCRTCLRPLTWETRTEPGYKPRTGWYDDARTDPLVCFKAVDYRHAPLTDREWAYYEAGYAACRQQVEAVIAEPDDTQWWPVQPYMDPPNDDEVVEVHVVDVARIRAVLAEPDEDGGAA